MKEEKKERKFERLGKVFPPTFNFSKEGDHVEGTLMEIKTGIALKQFGIEKNAYLIKTDNGQEWTIWGTGLLDYILMDTVKKGDYLRIVYEGKKKVKGCKSPVHQFIVEKAV